MLLHPTSTDCPHTPKHRCDSWPICPHAIEGVECNLCIQMLFPGCLLVTNEVELAHEWVPIAVHITATARKNLEGHLWNAQEDIYYCDSISADRTVVLRSPNGDVVIEPVAQVWERVRQDGELQGIRGKTFIEDIRGWKALAMDDRGQSGWFPLKRMIAHKVDKTMWKVGTIRGETEVTCDHGIMSAFIDDRENPPRILPDKPVTPEEFVRDPQRFIVVPPPKEVEETMPESWAMDLVSGIRSGRVRTIPPSAFRAWGEQVEKFWRLLAPGGVLEDVPDAVVAGVCYMLAQHKIPHTFDEQGRLTSGRIHDCRGTCTHATVREPHKSEWVYDLSVDGAHTFVDGMGRVLLHNTDSVITTVQLPSDPTTLGALKLEDEIRKGEFIACKIYAVEVIDEKTGHGHWKTKAKGFSKMNYTKFVDVKLGNDIKLARMTRIRELYRKGKIVPEENIVAKRLVQKCMAKRCMLPSGQSRPWTIEEIQRNRMDLGIDIDPMILSD